ncbi:transposase [Verrucomicrobium sp. BvORR106]|uniref:transposase n=1 Tax=Verrucomicrobium sp. BvORR106 TaxID=1403819 RepID=UPI00056FF117|nr:transposase [Verrucomicrobium sp. BvORR106]
MRRSRLRAPADWKVAYYHCVSRVVDRRFVLEQAEKRRFLELMRMYERFCQVRVVTFCLMSNHFHLLVEVPQRPSLMPSEAWLLGHIRDCFGEKTAWRVEEQVRQYRQTGADLAAQQVIAGWFSRMWDVSQFMKTLKQRFTQWFNKHHERRGTLWEDRFRSTMVEGGPAALGMVAAYIDLNPVRAGLVDDPKDYPWSGYGAAIAGADAARSGLATVSNCLARRELSKGEVLSHYRRMLYVAGDAGDLITQQIRRDAGRAKAGIDREAVNRVKAQSGELTVREVLRCRVRYFTAGAAVGSREFVNAVFDSDRDRFGGTRIEGARAMKGADFLGLCSLRDLQKCVITPPSPPEADAASAPSV